MKKNVWRNIFNFDSDNVSENNINSDTITEKNFNINDIVSSISEPTKSENIRRKNIQELMNTSDVSEVEEVEEIPLLMNYQSGGNIDSNKSINQINTNNYDNIDTEELEHKLREIFSGLDENHPVSQQGGRSKKSRKIVKKQRDGCDKEKPTISKNINIPLEYFNL